MMMINTARANRRWPRCRACIIGLLTVPLLAVADSASSIPGVVRQTNNVYLVENHSSAGMIWFRNAQRGATVLHLDAHDDCRFVSPHKRDRLADLQHQQAWDEIFRLSDLGSVSDFTVRPESTLFDLGNFIYPCMADGTVQHLIWVVPDPMLTPHARTRLQAHLTSALRLTSPAFTHHADGSFSFPLLQGRMTVTTLNAIPKLPRPYILDVDIDFFLFPHALTDTHLSGDLQWNPEAVCDQLDAIDPSPALTTISASVYGGYLPLMFRFLADASFDRLASGSYPVYARQYLSTVQTMRKTAAPAPLPAAPANPIYAPAHHYLAALLALMARKPEQAFSYIEEAADESPVYAKGWLDAAEALRYMNEPDSAMESIHRFEKWTGHATTESRAATVHVLRMRGNFERAERIARELTTWNPDPHFLLLHGGILAQMQRYREATEAYQRILTRVPQDYLAHYNLAYVYQQQGEHDKAIAQYRATLAIRDDFAAAHENLGYLLMRKGALTDAEHHLRRTLEINPHTAAAWGNLGFVLLKTDRPNEAVACYRKAISLDPNTAELQTGLTNALKAAATPP